MIRTDNNFEPIGTGKMAVYDSSRGFSRFIKNKFEDQFEVTVINNKQELKKHQISDSTTLFFIVNDAVDILLFSNLFYNRKQLFLGIATKNLEERLVRYQNIIPIDLELPKKELLEYIQHHLR
ncbi:hypothetical protein [Flavobacterium sp. XGLA_31]|uniref:hypothetical protein n=1 Tax=Flavobacterium sp. XGLA_31 TaxID=3447666 RepID=UPI003F2A6895